jgi:GntR family transcriptional regulator, transcriptional repressor for pyruvate dehydrogenase complex
MTEICAMTERSARASRTFETVVEQIRALISRGHLKPGDKLPAERDLSARLGVGRNAVREALRGLEQAGVVELRPGKGGGAFVTGGRPDVLGRNLRDLLDLGSITFDNLWEARLVLVDAVLELAATNMTEADFDALEANLAEAQASYRAGDLKTKSRRNIEFHDALARATGNPLIAAIMASVSGLVQSFTERLGSDPGPETLESRARLLISLRAGDVRSAQAEMRSDLLRVHRFYRALESGGPG